MHFLDIVDKALNSLYACIPRSKPAINSTISIIAHRGAHGGKNGCIENTIPAFTRALELGCWGIELDIQTTADRQIVVLHDPTLTRLWQVDKTVSQLSLEQLKFLVPEIPTLIEVVKLFAKKIHLFIEIKAPFTAYQALAQALAPIQAEQDYHLICLDEPLLSSLSSFSLPSRLLVADAHNTDQFCKLSLEKRYGGVLGHYLLLTNRRIQVLQQAGQQIGVGFIDSKNSLFREVNRNISWVFSNDVEKIGKYTPLI